MSFKYFILLLLLHLNAVAQDRPNVLLIMTDDQGFGDITSHGNRKINTPNLDRIANEGARLDNFYVSSVCAPTRASLLTGRYHIRTGVVSVTNNLEVMREDETTIAEIFRQNGYSTGCFGKWHNGTHYPNHPNGQGFDEFIGFCGGHFDNYFDPVLEQNGEEIKTQGFITDVLTDKAMEWIVDNKHQPFFCYIPYNAPHTPYQVPDNYFNRFSEMGFDDKHATLYGMIENIDDNIGRILESLAENDLEENTIVVFLTDNGPNTAMRYNAGMKGHKTHVDEGGERVPFFVRWKNVIPAGLASTQISAHIDVLPTLVDLCQISLSDTLRIDGLSIKNQLINNQAANFDRMIFSHRYHGGRLQPKKGAVRSQQYRYVLNPDEEGLYDMINDPSQKVNIKDRESEQFAAFQKAYSDWFAEVTKDWRLESIIPCGYDEFPVCKVSVVESHFTGDIQFHGRGFTGDWLENWTNPDDSISWDVNFINEGKYKFTIEYVCSEKNLGSKFNLSVGKKSLQSKVGVAFDEPFFPSHDRAPRSGELQKPWGLMEIGELNIEKGHTKVILSAKSMNGSQVMEVKGLVIEKVDK